MVRRNTKPRRAAVLLEVAIVIPLMILLVTGAVDVSVGVFRYHQVATLSREGARYACVHGGQYSADTGQPLLTGNKLKTDVLMPMSTGLDPALTTCTLSWQPNGDPYPYTTTETGSRKQNMVRVTVTHQWQPLYFLGAAVTLTSTSETPISR